MDDFATCEVCNAYIELELIDECGECGISICPNCQSQIHTEVGGDILVCDECKNLLTGK